MGERSELCLPTGLRTELCRAAGVRSGVLAIVCRPGLVRLRMPERLPQELRFMPSMHRQGHQDAGAPRVLREGSPYAAVTQSVPAVLTNQSAFMPVAFQAVALQAAAAPQSAARPQSASADCDCEDLQKQVKQLRKDVDELAETSNRITKVLEKLDTKLDDIDGRLKGKGI